MSNSKIVVAVRKRPLSKKQIQKNQTDIITVKNKQTVIMSELKQKVDLTKYLEETVFNFDHAFDQNTTNEEIYDISVRPLIEAAFQGAKVTCFAYGQTGSGKTFTMNGSEKIGVIGLYALGANDMFSYLADPRFQHLTAKLSYFQIYCGKLYDLLNKRQELKIRQDNKSNINIIGIQQIQLYSWHQFLDYLKIGASQRITSQNSANSQSSRSHGILQISLKDGKKTYGKISFIDLAGNERGADHTDQKKQTRIDGAQINKSLLSLKQCIRALDQGKSHTPFRGSKLTMVLKDSFVGFCKTVMIGNISPASCSSQNTLNTLRYADRVKQLKKTGNNEEPLSKQQAKARQMMLPRANKNAIKIQIDKDDDAEDIELKRQQAQLQFGIRSQKFQNKRENIARNSSKKQILKGSVKFQKNNNINKPIKEPIMAPNATKVNINNQRKVTITGSGPKIQNRRNSLKMNEYRGINKQQMQIQEPRQRGGSKYQSQRQIHKGIQKRQNNFTNSNNMTRSQTINQLPNKLGGTLENYSLGPKQNMQIGKKPTTYNQQRKQYFEQQSPTKNFNNLLEDLQSHPQGLKNPLVSKNLHQLLFKEEQGLLTLHNQTLKNQLNFVKSQMGMISQIQNGVQKTSTRDYMNALEERIDEKMNLLQILRQKMLEFRYHYDSVQEIQQVNNANGMQVQDDPMMGDDEQLLDDLH